MVRLAFSRGQDWDWDDSKSRTGSAPSLPCARPSGSIIGRTKSGSVGAGQMLKDSMAKQQRKQISARGASLAEQEAVLQDRGCCRRQRGNPGRTPAATPWKRQPPRCATARSLYWRADVCGIKANSLGDHYIYAGLGTSFALASRNFIKRDQPNNCCRALPRRSVTGSCPPNVMTKHI